MWNILKKILFLFSPELVHNLAILYARYHPRNHYRLYRCALKKAIAQKIKSLPQSFSQSNQSPASKLASFGQSFEAPQGNLSFVDLSVELGQLRWPNPLGLAAGLDKNAEAPFYWSALGFGAVELGTVTPQGQPGNDKPRLFRLPDDEALINRMGFNNEGMDRIYSRLSRKLSPFVDLNQKGFALGINLGKNKEVPLDKARDDYVTLVRKWIGLADYFTINVSSPNTPGLRDLQQSEALQAIFASLHERSYLGTMPFLLKLAPDLAMKDMLATIALARQYGVAGVVLANTTLQRSGVEHPASSQAGGLSGTPLKEITLPIVKRVHDEFGDLPIVATGGIMDFADMRDYLIAGASAVQLYTGMIYRGPSLAKRILTDLIFDMKQKHLSTFIEYRQYLQEN